MITLTNLTKAKVTNLNCLKDPRIVGHVKVGVPFEMFIFLQVEEVEVVAEAATETVAVIWTLMMTTTV